MFVYMVDVLPRAYFFRGKQVAFILDDQLDSGLSTYVSIGI